jgi:hypothetical protein
MSAMAITAPRDGGLEHRLVRHMRGDDQILPRSHERELERFAALSAARFLGWRRASFCGLLTVSLL